MSNALDSGPLTVAQRAAAAAQQAAELLHLDDIKALAATLAEEALESLQRDPAFAARVLQRYATLARPTSRPKRARSQPVDSAEDLTPIRHIGGHPANPGAPPDPYYLYDLYGAHQLRRALSRYKLPELRLATQLVQERNPGTKPSNKSKRDPLIDYIVEQVAHIEP